MKDKISTSFFLFVFSLVVSLATIIAAYLFTYYKTGKDSLIYLGLSQSFVAMFTPLGIYIGVKSESKKLNKLGLWGNVILLFYTAILIVMAVSFDYC